MIDPADFKTDLEEADRINLANCGAQHWVLIQWARGLVAAFDMFENR